ncbi:guanylate kinase [Fistulina hepatica ATCC 64428]|uniref:Guanylate kinase n=1 Tax=Fistulina hepatica ATCC 64428 TaxID=1128425 RepID=A0A0D7A5A4_9AGAR|nr:guanylate kinase [Fistulina hepatica ATCC 64428]
MNDFNRPLVVSGPSGVGKSTLLSRLFKEYPDKFGFSVSHTTRNPRPGETEGKEYHFVSRAEFLKLLDEGALMEHAEFSHNFYGTSFQTVHDIQEQGKRCLLDIESEGIRQIKKTNLNPIYLFISPPSMKALRSRLVGRGTESPQAVEKRISTAFKEMAYAREPGVHDYIIVNDDIERAYIQFSKVALGEEIVGDSLPPDADLTTGK